VFNKFFSDCQYMPQLRRYSPIKLSDGAKMAIFLHPVFFSEPSAVESWWAEVHHIVGTCEGDIAV